MVKDSLVVVEEEEEKEGGEEERRSRRRVKSSLGIHFDYYLGLITPWLLTHSVTVENRSGGEKKEGEEVVEIAGEGSGPFTRYFLQKQLPELSPINVLMHLMRLLVPLASPLVIGPAYLPPSLCPLVDSPCGIHNSWSVLLCVGGGDRAN